MVGPGLVEQVSLETELSSKNQIVFLLYMKEQSAYMGQFTKEE